MEAPGSGLVQRPRPRVVAELDVREPRSSLYRRLDGRTMWDGRGFAPVAHLIQGPL
jgi:hypothetical protein